MFTPVFQVSPGSEARVAAMLGRVALVLVAALSGPAHAEKGDRTRPLNFAADSALADDRMQRNVLSGNVEITKGTIVLRASRVEVRQVRGGTQAAEASGGAGGLAFFRQKRDGIDEYIEGEAERIEYDGAADVVRFSGRATLRRLRGATVADEVAGETIVYNNNTDAYQVAGGPASAAASGRVRGTLVPREAPPAPAPSVTPGGGAR